MADLRNPIQASDEEEDDNNNLQLDDNFGKDINIIKMPFAFNFLNKYNFLLVHDPQEVNSDNELPGSPNYHPDNNNERELEGQNLYNEA